MELVFVLTFLSVVAAVLALLSTPAVTNAKTRKALGRLTVYDPRVTEKPEDLPFSERVILPLIDRISASTSKLGTHERTEQLRDRLASAGAWWLSPEQFTAIRFGILGLLTFIYIVFVVAVLVVAGRPPWVGLPLVILSYYVPELWLSRRLRMRAVEIKSEIGDAIDNLAVAMDAGLAFDSALGKVAMNLGGPLGDEFGRVIGELQVGVSRSEALSNLGKRSSVAELKVFSNSLTQADKFGIPMSSALKTLAAETRTKIFQAAEEKAAKIPVKIVIPLVLLILPALMIVIIGPGIIKILEAF